MRNRKPLFLFLALLLFLLPALAGCTDGKTTETNTDAPAESGQLFSPPNAERITLIENGVPLVSVVGRDGSTSLDAARPPKARPMLHFPLPACENGEFWRWMQQEKRKDKMRFCFTSGHETMIILPN